MANEILHSLCASLFFHFIFFDIFFAPKKRKTKIMNYDYKLVSLAVFSPSIFPFHSMFSINREKWSCGVCFVLTIFLCFFLWFFLKSLLDSMTQFRQRLKDKSKIMFLTKKLFLRFFGIYSTPTAGARFG